MNAARAAKPEAARNSMSTVGLISGSATLINRKEKPQRRARAIKAA
jgi:hypothetical protein